MDFLLLQRQYTYISGQYNLLLASGNKCVYEYKSNMFLIVSGDSENDTECMPRAVEEFPANFFTLKQTQDGAISVHIVLALYMFGALAIVCDDYFVSSLEAICESKIVTVDWLFHIGLLI